MDYVAFIRACAGNPTNEQIISGGKSAADQLVKQFGADAVRNVLRQVFGETVVPQTVAPAAKIDTSAIVSALNSLKEAIANIG